MTDNRFDHYRELTTKLGGEPARALFDRLQVLALTHPEMVSEIEAFVEKGLTRRRRPEVDQRDCRPA